MIPVLSVSQFLSQINDIIAGEFIVEGEVSQYKISQNKWIFFDLKDDKAIINCFATVFGLKMPLEDGMKVRVAGYPRVREQTGKFSFTVQAVELVGEGSLKRAYELLKKKLTAEGLFEIDRKRQLPFLPQKIGVIASRDSAAFGDFKRIINNRWSGVEVVLRHTLVQGDGAIGDVVQSFNEFNQLNDNLKPDVLVLIRGGGSLEDLSAFNSEEVARAVYGSKIPVVCGVGHERDESLADLTADMRASTPSNAAEIVVPDKKDFMVQLEFMLENLAGSLEHRISQTRRQVEQNSYLLSTQFETPLNNSRLLIDK